MPYGSKPKNEKQKGKMKSRQRLIDEITDLCEQSGCSDKIAKIHLHNYVDRRWNSHPPQDFIAWFSDHRDYESGTSPTKAFNCENYRIQWFVARQMNLTHAQAERIKTQPRYSANSIKAEHAAWLVSRRRLKKEDVLEWMDDPARELFDAIRKDKPLRPILEKMGVYNEPPPVRKDADGSFKTEFAKLKALMAKIHKKMPIVSEGDIALEAAVTRTLPDP